MAQKLTRGLARLLFGTVPDDQIQRVYRVRVGLFFVSVVIIVAALFLIYQLTQTLYQLHLAEGERDRWQRPDDVIDTLKLAKSLQRAKMSPQQFEIIAEALQESQSANIGKSELEAGFGSLQRTLFKLECLLVR
jgi:hypothetical protein